MIAEKLVLRHAPGWTPAKEPWAKSVGRRPATDNCPASSPEARTDQNRSISARTPFPSEALNAPFCRQSIAPATNFNGKNPRRLRSGDGFENRWILSRASCKERAAIGHRPNAAIEDLRGSSPGLSLLFPRRVGQLKS